MAIGTKSSARALLGIVSLSCLLMGGCATLMGNNFDDDLAHWGETQRPADPPAPGALWGVSTKSQQVEKNLGVR